jgi:hypothetical protein
LVTTIPTALSLLLALLAALSPSSPGNRNLIHSFSECLSSCLRLLDPALCWVLERLCS